MPKMSQIRLWFFAHEEFPLFSSFTLENISTFSAKLVWWLTADWYRAAFTTHNPCQRRSATRGYR
jgi:hypothetical protein